MVSNDDDFDGILADTKRENRLERIFGKELFLFAHQRVEELAKVLWQEAGCPSSRDTEIWLKAEDQICFSGEGDPLLNARLAKFGYLSPMHPCGNCGLCRERAEAYRKEIDDRRIINGRLDSRTGIADQAW
jgi:hypothetical protein